ncbi:unnamed protein product [Coffea canephora]|uniref:Uncharacterized protein n=1 Tax=Coffea canephora TaxID=49390 RepID=A0A068TWR2_COFCA|nr:unnamed protein product [Coffea canephora]
MEIDNPKPNFKANNTQIKDEDLFKAAENGDVSVFESLSDGQLLKALSLRNEDGRSLLHVAVSFAQTQVVKILSAAEPSVSGVNSTDEEGWAPLHSAASSGSVEIVEILLSRGADLNFYSLMVQSSTRRTRLFGCTPLHRAASTGNSEVSELLIEEGAEVDDVDKAGQTPLMNAVICGNREAALLLIRHGANVDVEDNEGYTVLGRASDDLRPALVDAAKAMLEE